MLVRSITSVFVVAVTLLFFLLRGISVRFFDLFIYIIALMCAYEMLRALKDSITKQQKVLSFCYSILILPCIVFAYQYALAATILYIAVVFVFSLFHEKSSSIEKISKTVFSMFYPTGFFMVFAFINAFASIYAIEDYFALFILVLIFACSSLTDVCAYLVGSAIGGKKLCPNISPKKTISGAIGGIVGGICTALIVYYIFNACGCNVFKYIAPKLLINAHPIVKSIIIAVIGGIFAVVGEVGDLAESLVKRRLDIKDMGNILPGHGGILDRFDSIMFVSLIAYIIFSFLIVS